MTDSRDPEQMEWESELLRSARLDVPVQGARERVCDAVLSQAGLLDGQRHRGRGIALLAAGVLGLAAALALVMRVKPERSAELRPEPPVATPSAPHATSAVMHPPPCPRLAVAAGTELVIDDFEDKNARLLLAEGRDGTWALYSDGTAPKILPAVNWPWHPQRLVPPRANSQYGIHVTGGKMAKWGAVLTVDFASGACYDMSAYGGIEFWGKGTDTLVHFSINDIDSVPEDKGGVCTGECPPAPVIALDLAKTWKLYRVTWKELQQLSSPAATFDPKRAVTLSFGFHPQDTPFDVWIDDLRFIAALPAPTFD